MASDRPAPVIREQFLTPIDTVQNVDGAAVWHGPRGEHWLLSTAKSTNVVLVNDAATGAPIRRVGGSGTAAGQLRRPNGITVIGDAMLVVERDNHRVQAFRLPEFATIGTFGDSILRLPYGIGWYEEKPGTYMVYVTDNYELLDGSVPPDRELGERVKQFRLTMAASGLRAEHLRSFGDTAGPGVLRVVESIAADPANNRLLIAEETEVDSHIKVYDLNGRFTGRIVGRGLFPQQAEGIALYACGEREGYWLATDQGDATNTFHLFDRRTLEHVASFAGAETRRTDGVTLTQTAFGPFPAGALYASHIDASISALSWAEIAAATGVRADCVR
jgi:3-phytase